MTITMTRKTYTPKPGTKTAWIETESETETITEQFYKNFIDAAPFMRRLGGSETMQYNYTPFGYRVIRNISKSPDGSIKHIATFNFEN